MKQSLQFRLSQQLNMTPQLQQAIKLLQLSTLDIHQEIQQVLESNMMLESDEDDDMVGEEIETVADEPETMELMTSAGSETEIPDELPVDSTWDDIYDNVLTTSPSANNPERQEFENQRSKSESLQDHLLWQLQLMKASDRDVAIAIAIIDSINDDGYLESSLDDIWRGLTQQLEDLDREEVEAVLHRVQNFDPLGVGAIDVADCLRLQLLQIQESNPYRTMALDVVTRHLDLLAAQDRQKLMRKLGVGDHELTAVIALIRSLEPAPGARLQDTTSAYIVPDVYVIRTKNGWQVELNPDISPKLRINPLYSGFIKRADESDDNVSMKNHLQEARWFIKSLQERNATILRVAQCIVKKQTGFLNHGPIAMRPMVLKDVADELGLHEATISRATTRKYMHTPNGGFEFKYFFSSHVATAGGGECSAIAIKEMIKELLENENPLKPLSDSKIAELLNEQGIEVARRTIAKYRESLLIPPSSQRKRTL